ncbi:MAG: GNAT family N-acetyltransferase [Acidimicrobiia bacterium]|nr:GNAT family N-acetyltransferase [Acidimicrobiia bacterium]MBT8248058.1 GNAT family N-acetyltransferase [Acidimicrobiia bacterium]NNF88638.1 GNAT family N-acetyltransferase [Acidimicrobiia bacterium]NNL12926.1 GNAT family N-acetyltransferase [Acidimicrobiia bacterium]NNL69835.1 GNAT family N-acetyltransferase [Acidimicrobiia bacterium]
MAEVTLQEVTKETLWSVMTLEVAEDQGHLVAPNSMSIAEAYFEPKAWFRAICADEAPVGFLMLFDDPDAPRYYLWRMMLAEGQQRKGYGTRALELLVEYVRSRPNATEIIVGAIPGEGSPQAFYERFGFVPTGEVKGGEVQLKLEL